MFCAICRAYKDINDPASTLVKGITGPKRRETLVSHEKSARHIRCAKQKWFDDQRQQGPLEKCVEAAHVKLNKDQEAILSCLMNTAFLIAKKKMAFESFSSLCALQQKNGLKLGTQYQYDKSCREFISAIACVEKDRIRSGIKEARFMAVMGDGSTDISITEQEGVFVRYTALIL